MNQTQNIHDLPTRRPDEFWPTAQRNMDARLGLYSLVDLLWAETLTMDDRELLDAYRTLDHDPLPLPLGIDAHNPLRSRNEAHARHDMHYLRFVQGAQGRKAWWPSSTRDYQLDKDQRRARRARLRARLAEAVSA